MCWTTLTCLFSLCRLGEYSINRIPRINSFICNWELKRVEVRSYSATKSKNMSADTLKKIIIAFFVSFSVAAGLSKVNKVQSTTKIHIVVNEIDVV